MSTRIDPEPGDGELDDQLEPGVFARIFPRPSATEVAAAVAAAGFSLVQLNISSFGLPTLADPAGGAPVDFEAIAAAFAGAGVAIWGLSATYNMIHPDAERRRRETAAAAALVAKAPLLGVVAVTLCTGTRDPQNMWRRHRDNASPEAWADLRRSLEPLLAAAEEADVKLGVEPEAANVVSDATRARALLDELGAEAHLVGIVLDPANLLEPDTLGDQEAILSHAFATLGEETVCLQAKDVVSGGFSAPGTGSLDFDLVYRLRQGLPRAVPVVIQDTAEADTPAVRRALGELARRHRWRGAVSATPRPEKR